MNNKQVTLFMLVFIFSIIIICFFDTVIHKYYNYISEEPKIIVNEKFPKIVHLMYFPWERKTGKLKENELDFNHDFYNKMKKDNPKYEIKLWTLSKIKSFTNEHYPEYNTIWKLIKHPVQAVDFFRLLVVYHYGGIYWQYESKQKYDLQSFAPSRDKKTRLFIENIKSIVTSFIMVFKPIRKGKSEELLRIATQCFSAFPNDKFLYRIFV